LYPIGLFAPDRFHFIAVPPAGLGEATFVFLHFSAPAAYTSAQAGSFGGHSLYIHDRIAKSREDALADKPDALRPVAVGLAGFGLTTLAHGHLALFPAQISPGFSLCHGSSLPSLSDL